MVGGAILPDPLCPREVMHVLQQPRQQRLFEREADNNHVEPALLVQLAARSLARVLAHGCGRDIRDELLVLCQEAVRKLLCGLRGPPTGTNTVA